MSRTTGGERREEGIGMDKRAGKGGADEQRRGEEGKRGNKRGRVKQWQGLRGRDVKVALSTTVMVT